MADSLEKYGGVHLNTWELNGPFDKDGANSQFQCEGLNWVVACHIDNEGSDEHCYRCSVECGQAIRSTSWSCDASVLFEVGTADDPKIAKLEVRTTFDWHARKTSLVFHGNHFVEFAPACQEWKNLTQFYVRIVVHCLQGFRFSVPYRFNLLSPEAAHDRVLVIGGTNVYVQSVVLSMWSSFFEKLFNSDFQESKKEEIELKELVVEQFHELLLVIYPVQKPVDSSSVGYLLELADRFDMPLVTIKCGSFLSEISTLHLFDRIEMIIRYKLLDAQEALLAELSNVNLLNAMPLFGRITNDLDKYHQMSDGGRCFLLECIRQRTSVVQYSRDI